MSRWIISVVCVVAFLMGAVDMAQANPVSEEMVTQLVQGWINSSSKPLGNEIDRVEPIRTPEGQTLYYVVYLKPQGYVVVSADDSIEPIICFSAGSHFDAAGPLGLMLGKDLRTRQDIADSIKSALSEPKGLRTSAATLANFEAVLANSQSKWSDLAAKAKDSSTLRAPVNLQGSTASRRKVVIQEEPASAPVADASTGYAPAGFDVWIDPFIRSAWDQSKILNYRGFPNLYNISTPSNRPAGCVAVAMAQVMRYYTFPADGTLGGGTTNYYKLDSAGNPSTTNASVWTNYIGTYTTTDSELNMTNMPLDPLNTFTLLGPANAAEGAQWTNIAALIFDAGLSVNTAYGTNQSGALYSKIVPALTNTFRYTNAIYASTSNANFLATINNNIIGSKPVLLAISPAGVSNSGHMVIADGLAYSTQGTLFHHLNLGWGDIGDSTAWYNLPSVIAYNTINGYIYNIFPTNAGELIVGRVTNSVGSGVEGVTVSAGGVTNTTDLRGFFSLIVSPRSTNTLVAQKDGYSSTTVTNIRVGVSSGTTQGNTNIYVNLAYGTAITLTAGSFSSNALLEWPNPTNAGYSGLAHILWTTNSTQEWLTWDAPTGMITVGAAENEFPTNNVVSGDSLGGTESSLSFVHSNLTMDVTYYYKIWITNSAGGWITPSNTPGASLEAQATPDSGNLTMYFQDNSANRLVKCLKFASSGTVKLDTTVASTNMVAYNIVGTGDFDSDDVDDILFQRNTTTNGAPNVGSRSNSWYVWFMEPYGKLKSQTLVNTNDLTAGGTLVVRGIAANGDSNAVIITRSSGGYIRSYGATNGVIASSVTNYTDVPSITNSIGQTSVGVTSH